jgi:hypothetical protein
MQAKSVRYPFGRAGNAGFDLLETLALLRVLYKPMISTHQKLGRDLSFWLERDGKRGDG